MSIDPGQPAWVHAVPKEARSFQGHRAGFVTRVLANVIDAGIVIGLVGGLYWSGVALMFVVAPTSAQLPSVPFGFFLGAWLVLMWSAYTVAWATTGRTYGAKVMGVRVVNYTGRRMHWPGAALRATACLAFMPGLFWVIVSGGNRSVQDHLLRTSVIYDWTIRPAKPARASRD
jgi:uncharacterized RDD family membrane protein YckC